MNALIHASSMSQEAVRNMWSGLDRKKIQPEKDGHKKLGSRPGSNAYILNELGVGYRMIDEDARSGEINE